MLSPLPRRSVWAYCVAHFAQSCQPSPIWRSGRPAHCPFRGLLGVHSRYGLHTRAVTVYRDTLSEGFSHFIISMTAPVASGWSGCRVGFTPTGKRRLFTAHATSRHSALRQKMPLFDDLVGAGEYQLRNAQAQRLGGMFHTFVAINSVQIPRRLLPKRVSLRRTRLYCRHRSPHSWL